MTSSTSRIAAASLLFLFAGRATLAPGQSIIASMRPDPTATSFQFAQIDIGTGLSTPISPLGPNSYAGLGATASGQFYGVRSNQLWQVDIRENTETAIGPLAQEGIFPASGFDILPDGRAFASTVNRVYSVDLASGLATQLTSDNGVREALMAAGSTFPAPALGSLGSVVNDRLYAVDQLSRSLLAISPDTGAVEVVGGSAGVLASGMLNSGIARDRYRIGSALTGVDIDRDGLFDTLLGAVTSFDTDNDPLTPPENIGGLAQFDLSLGTWELIGTNAGQAFPGMASIPVPEPTTWPAGVMVFSWLALKRRASQSSLCKSTT